MTRPTDAVELLRWITERRADLERMERRALFQARLEGRFDQALTTSGISRKRGLALTRAENAARGRMIRWGRL